MEVMEGLTLFIVIAIVSGVGIVVISNSIDNCDLINSKDVIIGNALKFIVESGNIGLSGPEGVAIYGNELFVLEDSNPTVPGTRTVTETVIVPGTVTVTEVVDVTLGTPLVADVPTVYRFHDGKIYQSYQSTSHFKLYAWSLDGTRLAGDDIELDALANASHPSQIHGFDFYGDLIYIHSSYLDGGVRPIRSVGTFTLDGAVTNDLYIGLQALEKVSFAMNKVNGDMYLLPSSDSQATIMNHYSIDGTRLADFVIPSASRVSDLYVDGAGNRITYVDSQYNNIRVIDLEGGLISSGLFDLASSNSSPRSIMFINEQWYISQYNADPSKLFLYNEDGTRSTSVTGPSSTRTVTTTVTEGSDITLGVPASSGISYRYHDGKIYQSYQNLLHFKLYAWSLDGTRLADDDIVLDSGTTLIAPEISSFDFYNNQIHVLVVENIGGDKVRGVSMFSLDGTYDHDRYITLSSNPKIAISVNQLNGNMFILQGLGNKEIVHYQQDGTQLTSITLPEEILNPVDLYVDGAGDRIGYVTDHGKQTTDLEGVLVTDDDFDLVDANTTPNSIMFINDRWYISQYDANPSKLFVYNEDGTVGTSATTSGIVGNFFKYDITNNALSNKVNLGSDDLLVNPKGIAVYGDRLVVLDEGGSQFNQLIYYTIVNGRVTDRGNISGPSLADSGGISLTAEGLFVVFNGGDIRLFERIEYDRNRINGGTGSIGNAGVSNAQGITVSGDKIYIVDGSTNGIYSYDYDGTTISNKKLEILTHSDPRGIASSGSSLYVVDPTVNHVDIYSFSDITQSTSGWVDACEKNNKETQSTYALIPVIGILIAVILTIVVLRKL